MGTMASGEGVWAEKRYWPGKYKEGDLMGWFQWTRGACVASAHLNTSFGPQLTGCLHLFPMGFWSLLFHNFSRGLWLLSHLIHFEDSQLSAPEPLSSPMYTPPQGATALCFMRSVSHSPANSGPRWDLTSQSPTLSPLRDDWEQLR